MKSLKIQYGVPEASKIKSAVNEIEEAIEDLNYDAIDIEIGIAPKTNYRIRWRGGVIVMPEHIQQMLFDFALERGYIEKLLKWKKRMINEVLTKLHDYVYRNDHHITFRRWFLYGNSIFNVNPYFQQFLLGKVDWDNKKTETCANK